MSLEKVFVLMKIDSGELENVITQLRTISGVTEVSAVTGPYDIIAKVEGEYITDALGVVVREIRKVKGVSSTETLVGVSI
ncbi:MAG: Lrp/AsnC ligand binding domain-containing protein [Thermoplasmata archaeon]